MSVAGVERREPPELAAGGSTLVPRVSTPGTQMPKLFLSHPLELRRI